MALEDTNSTTSVSLLMQLRHDDRNPAAWRKFVDRYGPRIFGWCVHRGLSHDDAQDVTQEVLLKLATRLGTFEYNAMLSFRGWLRRITENAVIDLVREKAKRGLESTGNDIYEVLSHVEARNDLQQSLEEAYDLELLETAIARIRSRVSDDRYRAWNLMARHGQSAAEIARELNMKTAAVYSARHYVQSLIATEVQVLEVDAGDITDRQ